MQDPHDTPQPALVACEVTHEMVPEDETVVIQGKRVSARGKQILLDQLATGHAIDGELEAPTSLRRFGCALLDSIILGGAGAIIGFALGAALLATANPDNFVRGQGIITLITTTMSVAYFGLMHAQKGQTVGKMAGKFKVIMLDGSPVTGWAAFVRAMAFAGVNFISAILLTVGGNSVVEVSEFVAIGIGVYGLANAITVLATKDKRAIHDMFAGTRAVMIDE